MEVSRINIDDPAWREFVLTHPTASPFHLPEWAGLIADCYRFEAFVLAVRDIDGEIAAGLPTVAVRLPLRRLRWVSLPFTDNCPVLARPDVALEEAVRALNEYVRSGHTEELEVRSDLPPLEGLHPVQVGYRHTLALPKDPADLHPHRNYRQHRNQAKNRGVTVTRGTSARDVETFYQLLALTRRRLGVPVQPRRFFGMLTERLFAPGQGFVASATLDGEVVAACLYLMHNGTMVAKYAASDPGQPDTGASHLIHWETASAACVEGYHTYDLGRTDLGAEGLRVYKTRMGAEEQPLVYTHVTRRPPSDEGPTVGGLSKRVISNSPTWVCRAVGQAFYRWTA